MTNWRVMHVPSRDCRPRTIDVMAAALARNVKRDPFLLRESSDAQLRYQSRQCALGLVDYDYVSSLDTLDELFRNLTARGVALFPRSRTGAPNQTPRRGSAEGYARLSCRAAAAIREAY